MTRFRALILWAGVLGVMAIPAAAQTGPGSKCRRGPPTRGIARGTRSRPADPPTRVRLPNTEAALPPDHRVGESACRSSPSPSASGPPNSGGTPEIISRVGEILGAIDNPERRNELAEQWLQYSKQVIAKEQEFRDQWLEVQRQQLAQQEQATQLQREIAQLQMRIEELHAQNLRLEQENLQAQLQLSQRAAGPAPHTSLPTPPSP